MTRLVAIAPPAPALLSELAERLPDGAEPVLAACDRAVGTCVALQPEITVVAAPDRPRDLAWHPPDRTPNGRGATVALSGTGAASVPLGWIVADHLLDRVGHRGMRRRAVVSPDRPLPSGNLLLMADGSAARGERSPRVGAPGEAFDVRLEAALRTCSAAALADVDDTSAAAVGCTTAAVWRGLAPLAPGATCRWLDVAAPWGVTYLVGVWELPD